jgi:hypothetical protein
MGQHVRRNETAKVTPPQTTEIPEHDLAKNAAAL